MIIDLFINSATYSALIDYTPYEPQTWYEPEVPQVLGIIALFDESGEDVLADFEEWEEQLEVMVTELLTDEVTEV